MPRNLYRLTMATVLLLMGAAACTRHNLQNDVFTLTVIGTNDVHGELTTRPGAGGLTTFSGYLDAVRKARNDDGGAVLLLDAGDMWQGTLASNLNEGRAMVAAYNAMGYDAVALGNHEFDFGPAGPAVIPESPSDDPRGNLKRRARQAEFPLLAANLVFSESGRRPGWNNVKASTMITRGGVKIGLIGVMTEGALKATIAANVADLQVTPLAPAITREARRLRDEGAALVIVAAHAGGRCETFVLPDDLSSCRSRSEIFRVAQAIPAGLVDQIVAGHAHRGIAHRVNGIVITSSYSNTAAFSRVDYQLQRRTGQVLDQSIYPPQQLVAGRNYAGRAVVPNPAVLAIAEAASAQAQELKNQPVGVTLHQDFTLDGSPDSALGNLLNLALFESLRDRLGIDLVIQNVQGGMRQSLPAGPLTFGDVFKTFPFDNRAVVIELTGEQLRQVIESESQRGNRTVGIEGVTATIQCRNSGMSIDLTLNSGQRVKATDRLKVATSDYLALGGADVLTAVIPQGGFELDNSLPLIRDLLVQWLSQQPSPLDPSTYQTVDYTNWHRPDPFDQSCR